MRKTRSPLYVVVLKRLCVYKMSKGMTRPLNKIKSVEDPGPQKSQNPGYLLLLPYLSAGVDTQCCQRDMGCASIFLSLNFNFD